MITFATLIIKADNPFTVTDINHPILKTVGGRRDGVLGRSKQQIG